MTKGMNRTEKKESDYDGGGDGNHFFAILLDFTIVVVFMNTLQMIEQIF